MVDVWKSGSVYLRKIFYIDIYQVACIFGDANGSESEPEWFTGLNLNLYSLLDTPNDIISPGGSDGGEISPLNALVKRTWTHSHQTFQQRR